MKKYLAALIAVLTVCMVGMAASAAEMSTDYEEYKAAEKEQEAISREYWAVMDEMDPEELDLKTRMAIMTEAYENAGWTVIRESPAVRRSADIDPRVWELAYSDIDEASPEQREKIIDAREEVASHYSWQNDIAAPDFVGYVVDPFEREISFSPLYSELFPGWDQPRPAQTAEETTEDYDLVDVVASGVARAEDTRVYYDGNYYVPKVGSSGAAAMCSVPIYSPVKNKIETGALSTSVAGLTTINIGYDDGTTGERLQTRLRLPIGKSFVGESPVNTSVTKINPCISTYGTAGNAHMICRRTLVTG